MNFDRMKSCLRSFLAPATALLLLTTLGCGKSGPNLPEGQQALYEEVSRVGGICSYEPELGVVEVTFAGTKADDALVARLVEFPELRNLILDDTNVTDAVVAHLKKLPKLAKISLGSSKTQKRIEYQDDVDGKKIEMVTLVPKPLLSPAAVAALQAAKPDLIIDGIEPPPEESRNPA